MRPHPAPAVAGLLACLAGGAALPEARAAESLAPITLAEAQAEPSLAPETAVAQEPPATEATPPATAGPPAKESPWAGTLELYGFAPLRVTNTTTIRGFSATTDLGLGSILEHLTDILYLRGSVERGRVGLLTDLSYVGLATTTSKRFEGTPSLERLGSRLPSLPRNRDRPELPGGGDALRGKVNALRGRLASFRSAPRVAKAQVGSTQGIYDFALRYRFGDRERAVSRAGSVTVIPYAGVRLLDVGLSIDSTFEGPLLPRSRSFSFGTPIAQPLVGLQGQVFLAPRLRLFARGDMAGFDAGGNGGATGNAQLGLGYAIGNSTQLNLSWRYLYLARDNGKDPPNSYTIDQNGIEAGVKFFF